MYRPIHRLNNSIPGDCIVLASGDLRPMFSTFYLLGGNDFICREAIYFCFCAPRIHLDNPIDISVAGQPAVWALLKILITFFVRAVSISRFGSRQFGYSLSINVYS